MLPQDFCYYLLGVTEMSPTLPPTPEQWRAVTTRLDSVFNKVTPDRVSRYAGEATVGTPVILPSNVTITNGHIDLGRICAPSRDLSIVTGSGPMPDLTSGDMDKVTVEAVNITC